MRAVPKQRVEIRALRKLRREQEAGARFIFLSERGAPLTPTGFFKTLARAAESIGMAGGPPTPAASCNRLQAGQPRRDTRTLAAYLGHRQIANTARYTKMDDRRFDAFWQD